MCVQGREGRQAMMSESWTIWQRLGVLSCVVVGGVVALSGCDTVSDHAFAAYAEPGEPLPGLTESELERFFEGKEWFDHHWTPEEGLGPLYMQFSCGACHDVPSIGGAGVEPLREATYWDEENGCNYLLEEGGPLIQDHATPLWQQMGVNYEAAPPSGNGYLIMEAPALYGLGLLEAIPDETILAREDPDDADGDGISGRASWLPDGRLGRLGHKAYRATIRELAQGSFQRSLGLTNPDALTEETINGEPMPPEVDPAPDPEIDHELLDVVSDYIRYLAPAARSEPISSAEADSIQQGEQVFHSLGCARCHVPSMQTGPSDIAALDRKMVHLYSDLLLHDLAPRRPTICGPTATPSEVRTARLMGIRFRGVLMHDGRAADVNRAIMLHGGEASAVRVRYEALTPEARRYLIRFISTL
jgi:CxxC motif-containing protein (DUF1111 family)